jgi:hypothetical protein
MLVNSYLTSLSWVSLHSYDPSPAIGYETVKVSSVSENFMVLADTDWDGIGDTVKSRNAAVAAGDSIIGPVMESGKGYWLYTRSDGTLIP